MVAAKQSARGRPGSAACLPQVDPEDLNWRLAFKFSASCRTGNFLVAEASVSDPHSLKPGGADVNEFEERVHTH
jgi:hypothetical protein